MIRKSLLTGAAASMAILAIGALPSGRADASPAAPVLRAQGPPPAAPPPARPGIIGAGLHIELTPSEATLAAGRCSAWASKAGFTNNGYRHGRLVVAVAVGMAESGCDASACFDDTTGTACSPSSARGRTDSIDRGAWQINSRYWKSVTNRCAFNGLCNAVSAYTLVSEHGTYFRPWTTYLVGTYKRYLPQARAAVEALRAGTVTSAKVGWCAAYRFDRRGADVRLAPCGRALRTELWSRSAGRLRARGGLCMGAPSGRVGRAVLQRCSRGRRQQWQSRPGFTLYNKGARKCLTIPRRSGTAGHALTLGPCHVRRSEAWYIP